MGQECGTFSASTEVSTVLHRRCRLSTHWSKMLSDLMRGQFFLGPAVLLGQRYTVLGRSQRLHE